MEAKTDMTICWSSVFADDQRHIAAATHKHKWILKHLFVHQPFQKYVEFKQPNRKKERVFLKFMAETERGAKCRKINQNRQMNKNFLV